MILIRKKFDRAQGRPPFFQVRKLEAVTKITSTDYVKCPCNNFIKCHFNPYFGNNNNNNNKEFYSRLHQLADCSRKQ